MCESFIRDRLLKGMLDQKTSNRLVNERPISNLNRCVEGLRAAELTRNHKQSVQGMFIERNETAHVYATSNHTKSSRKYSPQMFV